MTELVLESPFNSALLLMDFQEFVLNNFVPAPRAAEVVARTSRFLSRVRQTDMLVVHVTVGCPPDGPPMDRRNRLFRELRESGLIEPGSPGLAITAALQPIESEPVITKSRVGAFTGTELDELLWAHDIETLLIAGATTSGVVLTTVRQAFDLDYQLVVLRDGCVDGDAELHDSGHEVVMQLCVDGDAELHDYLMARVISDHATITEIDEVAKTLRM